MGYWLNEHYEDDVMIARRYPTIAEAAEAAERRRLWPYSPGGRHLVLLACVEDHTGVCVRHWLPFPAGQPE